MACQANDSQKKATNYMCHRVADQAKMKFVKTPTKRAEGMNRKCENGGGQFFDRRRFRPACSGEIAIETRQPL